MKGIKTFIFLNNNLKLKKVIDWFNFEKREKSKYLI